MRHGEVAADPLRAWAEYDHELASLAHQMIGAADHFEKCPEYATDERLAATFRRYVERMRAVESPA